MLLSTELRLFREVVHAKHINARHEKEWKATSVTMESNKYGDAPKPDLFHHWEGQETAFKQLLDILDS